MSSVRLTTTMREKIAKNALSKSGVTEEINRLQDARNELARDARVFALGGKEKADKADGIILKLNKLAREFAELGCHADVGASRSASIYLAVSGRRIGWIHYGKDEKGNDLYLITPHRDLCMFGADHEITKRFDEIADAEAKVEKRKKDIEATVWAALNSVTTIKRLIELWPESKELLPPEAENSRSALPALKVEDLNRMIGLPTEQAA